MLVTALLLTLVLVLAIWWTTPWHVFPTGLNTNPSPDFTESQIESAHQLRVTLRWLSLTPWVITLIITIALGVYGPSRIAFADSRPMWVQVLVIVAAISLLLTIIRIPFSIAALRVSRNAGLSTSSWSTWSLDLMKGYLISVALTSVALILLGWAARKWSSWWIPASLGAAALAVVMSFLVPVIFEPIFNKFTAMPEGELRTSLLQLAERDGVQVTDVLIADASRRTTALNAYVSGFGATRRIVVYDTLVKDAPQSEIESVVAHELGHAKSNDVLYGTLIGALAAALAVVLLALLLGSRVAEPRYVPAVLALFTVMSVLQQPIASLISREIEMRADRHALELTNDSWTFIEMQKRLALTNRADLRTPRVLYLFFGTHPSTMERIAFARFWAAQQ